MSGSAPCFCCTESGGGAGSGGSMDLDRALDELGMLATVPQSRRQHQAETRRRRRRYTISALQRRPPAADATPAPHSALSPSASAEIAEKMSRIRLDGTPSGEAITQAERAAFETLYINWGYVRNVGAGPLRSTPAAKTRRSLPYDCGRWRERSGGGRVRTSSWGEQEPQTASLAQPGGPSSHPNSTAAHGESASGNSGGGGTTLVRSLSMENLKLGETKPEDASEAVTTCTDVDTIRQGIGGLKVESH